MKDEERECMKCRIWDTVAKEHGKRGICGECFDRYYVEVYLHHVEPEMGKPGFNPILLCNLLREVETENHGHSL